MALNDFESVIYDDRGKELYQSETSPDKMNLKALPAGQYILKIQLADGRESGHVIVKR